MPCCFAAELLSATGSAGKWTQLRGLAAGAYIPIYAYSALPAAPGHTRLPASSLAFDDRSVVLTTHSVAPRIIWLDWIHSFRTATLSQ